MLWSAVRGRTGAAEDAGDLYELDGDLGGIHGWRLAGQVRQYNRAVEVSYRQ